METLKARCCVVKSVSFRGVIVLADFGVCTLRNYLLLVMKQISTLVVLLVSCMPCMALVVADTNVFLDRFSSYPDSQMLEVYQAPTADYTGIAIRANYDYFAQKLTVMCVNYVVDEGVDAWLAPFGFNFSSLSISAGQFEPLHVLNDNYSFTITDLWDTTSLSFYLGLNTGQGFSSRNVFGWVELQYLPEANALIVVDSAMAYGEQGIYIGLDTPVVPEPGNAIFGATLLLAALNTRRRGRPGQYFCGPDRVAHA